MTDGAEGRAVRTEGRPACAVRTGQERPACGEGEVRMQEAAE